jgi:hypothetical protein
VVSIFSSSPADRRESGVGQRVVRIGTHALNDQWQSTLRQCLAQHRGGGSGWGNHRGSIFRLLVGQALLARGDLQPCWSWGVRSDIARAATDLGIERTFLAATEAPVERAVSRYLFAMPFLWVEIGDQPGTASLSGFIERNAISLLSNWGREPLDPPSEQWLGRLSDRPLVGGSGMWNQRHVEETHDPAFLDIFERIVEKGASDARVS